MGGEAVGDVRTTDGQWRKAERAPACARQPRGTSLGAGVRHPLRSTVPTANGLGPTVPGMHQRARACTATKTDVACLRAAAACAGARRAPQFQVALFDTIFLKIM
jgi:hypothetical protein